MQKIRIITDSGSDIISTFNRNITVLPMTICFGEEEYLDGVDITHNQFYEKLIETDVLPKTSLVSPSAFDDAFHQAVENGEKVIAITISSKLSGTYQSALIASEKFGEDVFVVDSKSVAVGERILVMLALDLVEKGLSPKQISGILENEREKIHLLAVLDTLEYLKKGGRTSKSVALVGGALSIKPVVTVKDGDVAMIGKARGSRNGNNYLINEIENTGGVDFTKPLRLGYTGLGDELLKKYIVDSERLWKGHSDSLVISQIGATVGTHVGPGAIAVAFFSL